MIDYLELDAETVVRIRVPPQMTLTEFVELTELRDLVGKQVTMFSSAQFFVNLVLAKGLNYLWNMVNLL